MENRLKWKVMVVVAISLALAGCGQEEIEADHLGKIPGTDRIAGTSGSVFVSPDEKYLVYLTENFATGSLTGIESVDLQTGQIVKHSLNRVPKDVLEGGGGRLLEKANASRGYDAGWLDGKLYLPVVGTAFSTGLVIDGSESDVGFEGIPSGVKMLADGPEWGAWKRELKKRVPKGSASNRFQIQTFSSAWLGAQYDETTFFWDRKKNTINSGRPEGQSQELIRLPSGGLFKECRLSMIRVSPDKSYLVYVLSKKPKFILSPFMEESAHVLHLKTGESRVVCRFRMIDNLQWSADGRRLYLSGNNLDDSRGVYVVKVARAFGE